ncbi:MAG: hypothetical protein K2N34_06960 [Lachnospiraceae bacterium]|nr:hypothetical protein [Lachnospiraceae bacterium]
MIYTDREQLTVIELENGEESVSMNQLKKVLMEYPSNMLYCESKGELIGIISVGDIYRTYEKLLDRVKVNKNFKCLYAGEYMKAKVIFGENDNISAIPVVTKNNILIGDYTRWDDLMVLQYRMDTGSWYHASSLNDGRNVALVRPSNIFKDRKKIFDKVKEYLQSHELVITCIEHSEVPSCLELFDMILFVDENEIRACKAVLMTMFNKHGSIMNRLKTYKHVIESDLNGIGVSDEQAILYLKSLYDKGINIFGLIYDINENTPYSKRLLEEIGNKFEAIGEMPSNILPKSMYEDFFDDLYDIDFVKEILNINLFCVENRGGVLRLKDQCSKYYNVMDGERCTTNQPENYVKSIYFFGPCYILGRYSDDSHTIESLLQKRLCNDGIGIRVVNCGCFGLNFKNSVARISVMQLRKGDIIIIDQPPRNIEWMEYVDLNEVLQENNVGAEWLVDNGLHCNHKVYKLYADAIYGALTSIISADTNKLGEWVEKDENYIKFLYLDQYMADFDCLKYEKVGSIVMNCNPFTYGHRYLIELALQNVELLILFVVEEDKSIFSFAERFTMVCEGVADLENVKVVPSGPFILSQMSFPEYFIKETSEDIVEHTEQDIMTFAEKIAPQLNIRYRFVGEEPEDSVTNQYNLAMKKILPRYGMEIVEIPRKKVKGQYISASSVRKCMEQNDKDELERLLPKTTRKLIFGDGY